MKIRMGLLDQVEQYPQPLGGSQLPVVSRIRLGGFFVASEFGNHPLHGSSLPRWGAPACGRIIPKRAPLSDIACQL